MTELASSSQLRMSYVRWALVTVPAIFFLGFLSGRAANSGYGNPWFDALVKPAIMPPGWVFGVAWSILYVLLGLALANVMNARGNRYRRYAIALFVFQLALNLCWSPLFFAMHQVLAAFVLTLFMLTFSIATTIAFGRVRTVAAWLMVPYLVWISFAAILTWQVHTLNPNAETLAPPGPNTQIDL
jgi:translocator protein